MQNTKHLSKFCRGLAIGVAALALAGTAAQARDLTIVSFGGNFQDAQRELFFKPFAEKLGKPVLDESWDGGYGVLQSKVKAGNPNWDVVQVEAEELMTAEWPKRASIRGRAVLAVACRLGALDFSTGERLDKINIGDRHYHHVFPDALLKEAEIDSFLALNCALITDKTNISIGRKDPLVYLKDRYQWTVESIVNERLQSHLIPVAELSNGGYEGLSDSEKNEKLSSDFKAFLSARAEIISKAARRLAEGHQLSAGEFYSNA